MDPTQKGKKGILRDFARRDRTPIRLVDLKGHRAMIFSAELPSTPFHRRPALTHQGAKKGVLKEAPEPRPRPKYQFGAVLRRRAHGPRRESTSHLRSRGVAPPNRGGRGRGQDDGVDAGEPGTAQRAGRARGRGVPWYAAGLPPSVASLTRRPPTMTRRHANAAVPTASRPA